MDASTVTSVPAWGGREVRDEHPQSGGDCNRGRLLAPSSAALAAGGGGGVVPGPTSRSPARRAWARRRPPGATGTPTRSRTAAPRPPPSNVMTTAVPAGETLNWAQLRNYAFVVNCTW